MQSHFQTVITDPPTIAKLVDHAIAHKSSFELITLSQPERVMATVKSTEGGFTIQTEQAIGDGGAASAYLFFTVGSETYCWPTALPDSRATCHLVGPPRKLLCLMPRRFPRFPIPIDKPIYLSFSYADRLVRGRLVDLSEGGFSFAAESGVSFQIGDEIKNAAVHFSEDEILKVDLIVIRHSRASPKVSGETISGVMFINISTQTRSRLRHYIQVISR